MNCQHCNDDATEAMHLADANPAIASIDWLAPLAPPGVVITGRHAQADLAKTIGARMRTARELCGLSQIEAARLLGYSNPSRLSKVESAFDAKSVPLWLLRAAAVLYEVSLDYLLGLTEEWESGAGVSRSTQGWVLQFWEKCRLRDLATVEKVHREVVVAAGHLDAVLSAVRELSLATSAYRERNPEFDDTAGSATLVSRIGRLEASATLADASLRKLKLGRYSEAA